MPCGPGPTVVIPQYTWPLGAEVHQPMSRLGGQYEARPRVCMFPSKLGTHLWTHCNRDKRLCPSGPTQEYNLDLCSLLWKIDVVSPSIVLRGSFTEPSLSPVKANDKRTSCPCHDEFRGPRSDYVRQVALATTTTTT
ncbi:hypothetical protein TNCV_949581 [Trichonephila clavipes]|nr:hypothetical protein TNCV_949581 [Trichonephila clavipes]